MKEYSADINNFALKDIKNKGATTMQSNKMNTLLEKRFRTTVQKNSKIENAFLLVHSEKKGIHLNLAEGMTGDVPAHPSQPFFVASIDKLFTSTLVSMLMEQGKLSYEDQIATYLEDIILQGLYIYKGKDYSKEVKIRHLLNHTSGLSGDGVNDKDLMNLLLFESKSSWTPDEYFLRSKEHLHTKFSPGNGFQYTDFGYYLLKQIVEAVTGKSYYETLFSHIIEPLELKNTYILQHTEPIEENDYQNATCTIKGINVAENRSIGMDYVGGRMISTTEDLLTFMKSLVNYQLVSEETLKKMREDRAKYFPGIDYSYGMMNFKHVPIIMPKRFQVWGHAGSIGSFMFYHPETENYFIGNLNTVYYHRKGIRLMFKMIDVMLKG